MGGRWQQNDEICRFSLSKSLVILAFFEWFSLQRNDVLVSEKHRISLETQGDSPPVRKDTVFSSINNTYCIKNAIFYAIRHALLRILCCIIQQYHQKNSLCVTQYKRLVLLVQKLCTGSTRGLYG